jgi:lipopolysaccharide export system protein LptA
MTKDSSRPASLPLVRRPASPPLMRRPALLPLGWLCCGVAAVLLLLLLAPAAFAAKKKQRPRRAPQQQDERIYLVHADVLHYDQWVNRDAQILNGKVQFRHKGATLHCDSAYFYEATNSFEAFGHVKMYQGDTLSLFSDYAFYDGNDQMAIARNNVELRNRKMTLYTDSLNFDRLYDNAYFFEGGKMVDGNTTLISDWGEYNTKTKKAVFNYDVKMVNKDMLLTTDTLYYDTFSSMAEIVGPTHILSGKSHIYSVRGFYDTKNDRARLLDRSELTNQGKKLVADSIYHDDKAGVSKAFYNIVYTDTVNKNKLTGEYGEYNDLTGYAMCTESAVVMDFSQRDTLYMHADTFKIFTHNINTDSVYRKIHAYNKVRAYRIDVQAVCDSLVYNSKDSCMTLYKDPIVWNNAQQLVGEEIQVFMKDSVIDHAHVANQAFSIEKVYNKEGRGEENTYNQISSDNMYAYFKNGTIYEAQSKDNVRLIYYPVDESDTTLIGLNTTETTELRMFMENRKMKKIWMPKAEGTLYPMSQIPPDKRYLEGFAWFDYVRPIDKDDIFNWRPKKKGTEIKPSAGSSRSGRKGSKKR